MRQLIVWLAALLPAAPALAQNAPLSALPERGAVLSTDIIPIEPAAGPQLMQTTVQAIVAAGGGTATGVTIPGFTCSGSPIIACTVGVPAGEVYAGPCGGAAAAPAFRELCAADLPPSGVTSGTYTAPTSITINATGQVTSIVGGACVSACGMPALSSFVWVNQGSATAIQPIAGGPIGMSVPDAGGSTNAWRGIFLSAPTCPWKVRVTIQASVPNTGSVTVNGLYLYDGTALIGFETAYFAGGYEERVEHITNVTTDGSTPYHSNMGFVIRNDYTGPWEIQIRDDCTNYYFDSSQEGVVFYNLYSEAVGSYLTAANVGYAADQSQGASSPGFFSLQNWQAYADANLNGP